VKILTTQGEEIASVSMKVEEGGVINTAVNLGGMTLPAPPIEVNIDNSSDGIIAHIRIPGMAKMDLLIEPQDAKQMMKIPMKGIASFGLKTLMSK